MSFNYVKLRYPAIRRYVIENLYEIQETVTTEKRKRRKRTCREKKGNDRQAYQSHIKGRKPMKEAGWMMRTKNIRIMERQKPMIQKNGNFVRDSLWCPVMKLWNAEGAGENHQKTYQA